MEIKYKVDYYLSMQQYDGSYKDINKLKKYLEAQAPLISEDSLEEEIYEFFWHIDSIELINPKDEDSFEEMDKIDIDNIEELLKYFSYLVREKTCCEEAPYNANFCPTCGKKLK